MNVAVADDQVLAIAQEVFAALVDGEAGGLTEWWDDVPLPEAPLCAWVDLHGPFEGRARIDTALDTAQELTRVLLGMADGAPVSALDLVDAFGEIANVVGGNVKALLPEQGTLGLPNVAPRAPVRAGEVDVQRLALAWRGRPLVVTVSASL